MSVAKTRKDREKAEREELIITHAGRLLVRDGYQNLNLDVLAEAVEYSKGTLYLHFKTKEDLVLAVATRALRERADLFERASRFSGRSRERIRAIGFACCQFALLHRDYFSIEMTLKSISFWENASEEQRRQHGVQSGRVFHAIHAIVQEAVLAGDLPRGIKPQDVVLSLISVTIGSHIAATQPELQMLCAVENPIVAVRCNQDLIIDGLGWKPLLKDWDYAATDRRIKLEIFPEASWLEPA